MVESLSTGSEEILRGEEKRWCGGDDVEVRRRDVTREEFGAESWGDDDEMVDCFCWVWVIRGGRMKERRTREKSGGWKGRDKIYVRIFRK